MNRLGAFAVFVSCLLGCGGSRQASQTVELMLSSPLAELAQALAPDLYTNAKLAFAAADDAARHGKDERAEDLRTEGRLWLAAGVAEAERVQLDQKRLELQDEEEKWGKQLARDRAATGEIAREIARQEASGLALAEADRLAAARQNPEGSAELVEALMFRLKTELAVAEAFGAPADELRPLRQESVALERASRKSARAVEALLAETSALVGRMRAEAPQPAPGASTELVDAALAAGFSADQDGSGTVVRSERMVSGSGLLSTRNLAHMQSLLDAFPHGPVLCELQISARTSSARWDKAAAQLSRAFSEAGNPGRVSFTTASVPGLDPGTLQCRFSAYVRF